MSPDGLTLLTSATPARGTAAAAAAAEQQTSSASFMEAFKEKLNDVKKIIEEDKHRRRVLLLCQQTEPRSFDDYSSSGSFRKLEKFESSTYSEVLKAVDLANNNKPVVMKIMRALSKGVIRKLPGAATRGCQAYSDILNELVVTQALSQLHDGVVLNGRPSCLYKTHFFCFIHEIKVVSGNLERAMRKSQSHRLVGNDQPAPVTNNNPDPPSPKAKLSTLVVPGAAAKKSDAISELNKREDASDLEAMLLPQDSAPAPSKTADDHQQQVVGGASEKKANPQDEEVKNLSEDDRMLMESLPYEYVVTVMRHDGQPLWWWMTQKKLGPEQLTSVLVQVIVGLAIAEKVYLYEHRDLHVSNILIKKTSKPTIPFILEGNKFNVLSNGIKATIIDATFSRLTHNGKVYYRDLTSTLRAYGGKRTPNKMSLQNRSYRQMVQLTSNNWDDFTPRTNLIWLTYLCETLMKSDILKGDDRLMKEVKKIRDYTLKVNTTLDLLSYFPFDKEKKRPTTKEAKQSPRKQSKATIKSQPKTSETTAISSSGAPSVME